MHLKLFFVIIYMFGTSNYVASQVIDSLPVKIDIIVPQKKIIYLDSATIARNLFVKDSITHIQDSITWQFLKTPALNRPNLYINSLLNKYIIKDRYLLTPAFGINKYVFRYGTGQVKTTHDYWILVVSIFLILYFSALKYFFSNQIRNLFLAFYQEKYFKIINTDRNLFITLLFLLIFMLFCLSAGTYIYVVTNKIGNVYWLKKIELLALLSIFVLLFTIVNNILIRLIGTIFNVTTITNQYLNLLYVSMFTSIIVLVPFSVILLLIPSIFIKLIIWISIALIVTIYIVRFLRMLIIIVNTHAFSKTYIFLYVCAFELCPIIILTKALNIS